MIRIELLAGPRAFLVVVGILLGPLGAWLLTAASRSTERARGHATVGTARIFGLALAVGAVGGIYGIGGGSILAPTLLALGLSVYDVAGAALAATFLTSVAGLVASALLQVRDGGTIAPHWTLGLAMGVGGLLDGNVGVRLQPRIPESAIRRTLGVVVVAVAARYLLEGLSGG